ncbi:MAG TPA: hypothetical protein VHT95_03070 [Vicinamibacterales bacterium]|jgi:hypothetical protein|nr:hypothetical protein [Vicinamibacterales bacterium]
MPVRGTATSFFPAKQAVFRRRVSPRGGYGIGILTSDMPTTTSAEQSLINGSELRDDLGQFSDARQASPAFAGQGAAFPAPARRGAAGAAARDEQQQHLDAFDALDSGLATDGEAPAPVSPRGEGDPVVESSRLAASLSAPEPRGIPFMTAALILVACLTAGATTAACLFQDQLMHITARPSATR